MLDKKHINWFQPHYWGKEKQYVLDALESTWISDGEYIRKFESTFGERLNVQEAITVSNGTTALQLAMLSLSIKPQDEIIIPGYTFSAPANMALAIGAKPVFADVDANTWCMSADNFSKKITHKTKAVIPVHIYGNVCEMDKITALAKQHNIAVIEDVAEAAFSKYYGAYAGTLGDMGCFSFQATKTIAMGEGGAVITNRNDLAKKARLIRNHGMYPTKRYWHEEVGHNFRLTNMQAALGYAQLELIDEIIKNKQRVYQLYKQRLENTAGITLQYIAPEVEAVIWAIAIKIDSNYFCGDRDFIMQKLSEKQIETRTGFYSFNQMPLYDTSDLSVSDDISRNIISLPSYPVLEENEIDYICDSLLALRI